MWETILRDNFWAENKCFAQSNAGFNRKRCPCILQGQIKYEYLSYWPSANVIKKGFRLSVFIKISVTFKQILIWQ